MFPNLKCHEEEKEFFDVEDVNIFIPKNCWNIFLVKKLLPANPAKRFLKVCEKNNWLLDWKFYS